MCGRTGTPEVPMVFGASGLPGLFIETLNHMFPCLVAKSFGLTRSMSFLTSFFQRNITVLRRILTEVHNCFGFQYDFSDESLDGNIYDSAAKLPDLHKTDIDL